MRVPCAKTLFSWIRLPNTRQIELALGRIRVFAYFDIEAFADSLKADGLTCTWVTGKDADEIRKLSSRIPGAHGAYGLKVQLPSGVEQVLMNGFFSRIYLYLTRPISLISMIKNFDKEKREIEQRLALDKQES